MPGEITAGVFKLRYPGVGAVDAVAIAVALRRMAGFEQVIGSRMAVEWSAT